MRSGKAKQDYGRLIPRPPVYGFYFTAGKEFTLLLSQDSHAHAWVLAHARTHARTHVDAVPHIRHLCKIGGGGGRQCKSEENHLCPALNLSRCWIQSPRGKKEKPINVLCDIIGGDGDSFLVNTHIAPHTRVFMYLIIFIPKAFLLGHHRRPSHVSERHMGLETDITMTKNPSRISILPCFVDFWTQLASELSIS